MGRKKKQKVPLKPRKERRRIDFERRPCPACFEGKVDHPFRSTRVNCPKCDGFGTILVEIDLRAKKK
jgi:uncharacterized protein (DUF983 family)